MKMYWVWGMDGVANRSHLLSHGIPEPIFRGPELGVVLPNLPPRRQTHR